MGCFPVTRIAVKGSPSASNAWRSRLIHTFLYLGNALAGIDTPVSARSAPPASSWLRTSFAISPGSREIAKLFLIVASPINLVEPPEAGKLTPPPGGASHFPKFIGPWPYFRSWPKLETVIFPRPRQRLGAPGTKPEHSRKSVVSHAPAWHLRARQQRVSKRALR